MTEWSRNPHNCAYRTRPLCLISEQDLKDAGHSLPQCSDVVTIEGIQYELVSKDSEVKAWVAEELPNEEFPV